MFSGTTVNMYQVKRNISTPTAEAQTLPLFMCFFSSDKGTENMGEYTYNDFINMYGKTPNFFKHGQPLVQAYKILAAGGSVLAKRLVAEDATFGNVVVMASVTDVDGKASIKYSTKTVTGKKTYTEVVEAAKDFQTETEFPLFIICDNGRGASLKAARIMPNYDLAKSTKTMIYNLIDVESGANIESVRFTIDPDTISNINGKAINLALTKNSSVQFNAETCSEGFDAFLEAITEITGYEKVKLLGMDPLFGCTIKGKKDDKFVIDDTGVDINSALGMPLTSGTNGAFGSNPYPGEVDISATTLPASVTAWSNAAIDYLNGTFSEEIFDRDMHKIDYIVDANYPFEIKEAIVTLVAWREDAVFFRDMGLNIYSFSNVEQVISSDAWVKSPFVADYCSVYDVIDTSSRKQVAVTMMHGFAPLLAAHHSALNAPCAGQINGFIISEAVPNTLRFIPRETPNINNLELLDENNINYCTYTANGVLTVMDAETSQAEDGPLSPISNVLITQALIKDIRRYVPKIRFMITDTGDFSLYKKLINDNVVSKYSAYFQEVYLDYTADDEQTAAKQFVASLFCYYKAYAKGEVFNVFSLDGTSASNPYTSITEYSLV